MTNTLDLNKDEDFVAWNWLTSKAKVNLDKVKDFNNDFSNGYLIGEALYNSGMKIEYEQLKNDNNRQDILRNYTLIYNCLSKHGINFDSSLAKKIINKEPGTVVKLIYDIAKQTESVTKIDKLDKDTKKDKSQVNVNQDKLINNKVVANEQVSYNNVLQRKFSEIRELNEEEAKQMREMDDHTRNYHLKLLRLEELEKSKRHNAFMTQWMNKGLENHRKNLTIRE